MNLNLDYLAIISLVLLVEIPVFWFTCHHVAKLSQTRALLNKMGFLKFTGWYCLLTLCIHPLVFFGFMASGRSYLWSVILGQVFAIVAKTWLGSWSVRRHFKDYWLPFAAAGTTAWQLTPVLIYFIYYVL